MRLRLERQRPTNLAAVVEELRARADSIAESPEDDAFHALAQVEATRRALLDALEGLSVAVGQLRRQVSLSASSMEIDRRLAERRDTRPGDRGDDGPDPLAALPRQSVVPADPLSAARRDHIDVI
ncbi:MAG: hypothetical protein ACLGIA_03045 [Actinomycetes bacterium]